MTTQKKATKPALPTTLAIDEIMVPDLRITSQLDPHIMDELRESINRDGILQPLQIALVGDKLWLEDGLHRLALAKELGIERVPVIIHRGTEGEVMVRNLILNRQRGKSNPAQEAQVIRCLIEEDGKSGEEVSQLTGVSEGWVSRLYAISKLPDRVLQMLADGLIGVTAVAHLVRLESPDDQLQVAQDAVNWRYTESLVKQRVADIIGARQEVKPGETAFGAKGEPIIVPLTCRYCLKEMEKGENWIWICADCRVLVDQFISLYRVKAPLTPAVSGPAPHKRLILTRSGWVEQS